MNLTKGTMTMTFMMAIISLKIVAVNAQHCNPSSQISRSGAIRFSIDDSKKYYTGKAGTMQFRAWTNGGSTFDVKASAKDGTSLGAAQIVANPRSSPPFTCYDGYFKFPSGCEDVTVTVTCKNSIGSCPGYVQFSNTDCPPPRAPPTPPPPRAPPTPPPSRAPPTPPPRSVATRCVVVNVDEDSCANVCGGSGSITTVNGNTCTCNINGVRSEYCSDTGSCFALGVEQTRCALFCDGTLTLRDDTLSTCTCSNGTQLCTDETGPTSLKSIDWTQFNDDDDFDSTASVTGYYAFWYGIYIGIPVAVVLILVVCIVCVCRRRKRRAALHAVPEVAHKTPHTVNPSWSPATHNDDVAVEHSADISASAEC